MSNVNTSQTELIFRGLDAEECSSFIREVHKRAHEAGRLHDNTWMADIAIVAFDGGALDWFDEQTLETQADWILLRRALIQKYRSSQVDPVPLAAIVNPRTMAISPTAPAAAPVAGTLGPSFALPAASTPRPASIQPSNQVRPYQASENPRFNIRVIAPKIQYAGFVSTTFTTDGFGHGCCTLTEELPEALECHDVENYMIKTTIDDSDWHDFDFLTLQQTRPDSMSATLALFHRATPMPGETRFNYVTLSGDKTPLWNWDKTPMSSWNVDGTGRLRPSGGNFPQPNVTVIGKTPDGDLTLYFWNRRVWDEADDAYAAELYFVRVN